MVSMAGFNAALQGFQILSYIIARLNAEFDYPAVDLENLLQARFQPFPPQCEVGGSIIIGQQLLARSLVLLHQYPHQNRNDQQQTAAELQQFISFICLYHGNGHGVAPAGAILRSSLFKICGTASQADLISSNSPAASSSNAGSLSKFARIKRRWM